MPRPLIRGLIFMAATAACAASLFGSSLNERIAISSTASPGYDRSAPGATGVRPETYVFMRGKYFPGGTRDHGLEAATFDKLTQVLATDLAKQNYLPTKDPGSADLVIMLHWGATLVYEDPQKDTNMERLNTAVSTMGAQVADGGIADTGPINEISESMASAQGNSQSAMQQNAALLGYTRQLGKRGSSMVSSTDELTLRMELSEERYFVVLMAYDNQVLKKTKVGKLRWVTRLSVRTAGNNFTEALPALSHAGAGVFGVDLKGLVHAKANLREGKVELGDLKIVSTEEVPQPSPPKS